mmetsp:Transcript_35295/g.6365  ORF Transcript_35295/g.6365 Transcript_35295/m.6365 type:complete len:146 (+) Transcript_35295:8259-8696(+)
MYSPGHLAGSEDNLRDCPAGNKCIEGSKGYEPCLIGTFCNEGVSSSSECPGGNFCPHSIGNAITCPAGWYCPLYSSLKPVDIEVPNTDDADGEPSIIEEYTYPPFKCPEGTVCPPGAIEPIDCTPGFYAVKARAIDDQPNCEACA